MNQKPTIFMNCRQWIKIVVLACFLFAMSDVSAQINLDGTWYAKSYDGELNNRLVINGQSIVYESYETYNVEEPYWKVEKEMEVDEFKSTGSGFMIARNVNKQFYGGEFSINTEGDRLSVFRMNDPAFSFEELQKVMGAYPMKAYFAKVYYAETRLKEIQGYPSLDQINKKDVILLIQHMSEQEKNIGEYKEQDRMISRLGRSILNQKLIEMGYDPDKPSENGYFMKRFADDPDVKALLDQQQYFKLY